MQALLKIFSMLALLVLSICCWFKGERLEQSIFTAALFIVIAITAKDEGK